MRTQFIVWIVFFRIEEYIWPKSSPYMIAAGKLTNLQQELLKLYAQQVSETDLQNIRTLIGQYFANRLTNLADKAWEEKDLSETTMHKWLNEEDQ